MINPLKKLNRRGQSMLEFALIAPVLLLLTFGSFDLGITMWKKMLINQAVISGVRVAATQTTADDAQVKTVVKNVASFLGDSNITINRSYTILSASDSVELKIAYTQTFLTQLLPWANMVLNARMSMIKETT